MGRPLPPLLRGGAPQAGWIGASGVSILGGARAKTPAPSGGRPSARALTPADGVWGHRSSAAPEGREQRTGPQNRRPRARALTPADGVWGHRSSAAPEGREQRTGPQNRRPRARALTPADGVW